MREGCDATHRFRHDLFGTRVAKERVLGRFGIAHVADDVLALVDIGAGLRAARLSVGNRPGASVQCKQPKRTVRLPRIQPMRAAWRGFQIIPRHHLIARAVYDKHMAIGREVESHKKLKRAGSALRAARRGLPSAVGIELMHLLRSAVGYVHISIGIHPHHKRPIAQKVIARLSCAPERR